MINEAYYDDFISEFDIDIIFWMRLTHGKSYDLFSKYKDKDLIYHEGEIVYPTMSLKFRFTIHHFLSQVNHILECWISFQDHIDYPISYVFNYLNIHTVDTFILPCISNIITLHESFTYLQKALLPYQKQLEDLSLNNEQCQKLKQQFKEEVLAYFHITDCKEDEYLTFHTTYLEHDCMIKWDSAYFQFLLGNYDMSLKKYQKQKKLSSYEKNIIQLMKQNVSRELPLPYMINEWLKQYNDAGILKNDKRELIVLAFSTLLLTCVWGVFYSALFFLNNYFATQDALFVVGMENALFIGVFIASFLSALATSYITRFTFYRLLFSKYYDHYIEFDAFNNTPRTQKWMKIFVALVIVGSTIFVTLEAHNHILFYKNGLLDKHGLINIVGEYYHYDDIKEIDQVNGYEMDEPTYILVFQNDYKIDLYEYEDIHKIEKTVIPFLKDQGIKIEKK